VVKAADRVEIYRALRVDAKTARRLRAEEQARRSG
jgi:putative ubiquitin-RnfH superfamily antitoxin RatB of RatAB toxin-antitoxin module